MTDSPMRPRNDLAKLVKRIEALEVAGKRDRSAPIRHASIDGPVTVSHRGGITAPSPDGSTTTFDPTGVTSTDADGKGVQVANGDVQVQAGPGEEWVPLEQIILDQVPPASDGLAPTVSPTPVLTPVLSGFSVAVAPVVNADPVTVDVFGSTISPVALDDAHRLATIENGGAFPVSALLPRTDYYFVSVARDVDGPAPVGTEVSGRVVAPSDGNPPSSSPTPVLVGGFGVMYVRLPTISNADPLTEVRVYASATSPVTTSATIVGRATNGGTLAFNKIGGTTLVPGTTYYVRTVAADVDGDGPMSAEGSGSVEAAVDQSSVDAALAAAKAYADTQAAAAQSAAEAASAITAQAKADAAQAAAAATAATDATAKANAAQIAAEAAAATYADAQADGAEASAIAAAATDAQTKATAARVAAEAAAAADATSKATAAQSAATSAAATDATTKANAARDAAIAAAAAHTDGLFPITETQISDSAISTPKLQANSVTAAKVSADVMVVNDLFARDRIHIADGSGAQIDIATADGIQQTYPDGSSRVSFPSDPAQPNVIDADLYTRGLTIEGKMSVRGTDNEISRSSSVTLATGTTPPTTSVAVQNEWPLVAGMAAVPADASGMFREGSTWRMLQTQSSGVPRMVIVPDSGAVTYQSLPFPAGTTVASGIVKVGSSWYALSSSGILEATVYVFNSSFALTGSWTAPGAFSIAGTIATDGTDIFLTGDQKILRYSAGGVLQQTITTDAAAYVYGLQVGSFNFGATRLVVSGGGVGYVLNTSGVTQSTFPMPSSQFGWNGTRFVAAPLTGFRQSSTLTADRTLAAAYEWYDSDPVGGNFASGIGQTVTFTQKAFSGLRFTTPPPADDGSSNAPDSARLYIGSTTANHLKGSPFVASMSLLDFDLVSGVAPGANTFPAGTAARIQSANGSAYFAGDGAAEFPQLEARVRQRSTHTGTQAASTISDFASVAVSATASVRGADSTVARNRANHYGEPGADWSNGDFRIRNLKDPAAPTDAANQRYVDAGIAPGAETYKASATANSDVTTGTNTVAGLSITVTCPGPTAVYLVELFADLRLNAQTIAAAIKLLVNGSPNGGQMALGGPAGLIIPAAKGWLVTGLPAGNRTFTIHHENYAGQGSSTITTNSDLVVQRKK